MGTRSDLFMDVCRNVRHGDMVRELSEAMAEAVIAAEESGKVGEVSLKITVKPNGRGQMIITDTVNSKVPRPDSPATLMFNDVHGNLSRRDPNQGDLNLRAADREAQKAQEGPGESHG